MVSIAWMAIRPLNTTHFLRRSGLRLIRQAGLEGDMKSQVLAAAVFLLCMASVSLAQAGSRSEFLLHFNGDLNSSAGEPPVQASDVTFDDGIADEGARLTRGSVLDYSSENKIDLSQGTIELWVKPEWNSDDNLDHVF